MRNIDTLSPLEQQIIADIQQNGPLPFVDFMDYCLYAPGLGYYDSDRQIFGDQGDFVTAPELSGNHQQSLFAGTLANAVNSQMQELDEYDLLEVGAGSGKLAEDLLTILRNKKQLPRRYLILERSRYLRQRQQQRLSGLNLPITIEWLDEPPQESWQGMIIANEVLDALPVERFRLDDKKLHRLGVDINDNQLVDCLLQPTPQLHTAITELKYALATDHQIEWPLPYTSEICLGYKSFIVGLTAHLEKGCALFIDYGYLQHEYYHSQRHMGTLVTHADHQGHFEPLLQPGELDISAFVDFTAVIHAAEHCDLNVIEYTSQANFLIANNIQEAYEQALETQGLIREMQLKHELQQLLMPNLMGEKFKAVLFQTE